METLAPLTKLETEAEIRKLTQQIADLSSLLKDHRKMQSGEFKQSEIQQELEDLKEQRYELLRSL